MGCAKHGQGTCGCRTGGCDGAVGGAKSGHRAGGGGHGAEEPRDRTQRGGVRTVEPGRGESSGIAVNTGDQRRDDGYLAQGASAVHQGCAIITMHPPRLARSHPFDATAVRTDYRYTKFGHT